MKSWKMKLFKCKHAGINGECNNPLISFAKCKSVPIIACPDKYAWVKTELNKPYCLECDKGNLVSGTTEFICHTSYSFNSYCDKARRIWKMKRFKTNHPIRYSFYKFASWIYGDPTFPRILILAVLGFAFSFFLLNWIFDPKYPIGTSIIFGLPGSILFMLLPMIINGLLDSFDEDEFYYLTKLEQENGTVF